MGKTVNCDRVKFIWMLQDRWMHKKSNSSVKYGETLICETWKVEQRDALSFKQMKQVQEMSFIMRLAGKRKILLMGSVCSCFRYERFLFGLRNVSQGGPGTMGGQGQGSQYSFPGIFILFPWRVAGIGVGGCIAFITSSLE